ncbi:hypothetical protein ElyMa_006349500 [Elysia marginata]|uniref:Uncharacterized protein n=1 Tax=Elysia marginata TaxID=1093978 RepID=A0AAV4HM37_9GAST|nr:hypothetical protein ElyMa_006349500 [Elysia marginata]
MLMKKKNGAGGNMSSSKVKQARPNLTQPTRSVCVAPKRLQKQTLLKEKLLNFLFTMFTSTLLSRHVCLSVCSSVHLFGNFRNNLSYANPRFPFCMETSISAELAAYCNQ